MSALRGGRRGGGVAGTCSALVYMLCDVDLSFTCLFVVAGVRQERRCRARPAWASCACVGPAHTAGKGVRGRRCPGRRGGLAGGGPRRAGSARRRGGRDGAVNGGPDGGGGAGAWCALALCACMVFIHTSPARAECAVCASRAALPGAVHVDVVGAAAEGGRPRRPRIITRPRGRAGKETGPRCGLQTTNGHGRQRRVAWAAGWAAAWTEAGSATACRGPRRAGASCGGPVGYATSTANIKADG